MKQSRFIQQNSRKTHHVKKHLSCYKSAFNMLAAKELQSYKRITCVPVSK